MSESEEEILSGTATRMQRLRDELEREQQARSALAQQVEELESQLRRLRNDTPAQEAHVQEDEPLEEEDFPREDNGPTPPSVEPNEKAVGNASHLAMQPLSQQGLHSLTKMYQSMEGSHRLQGVALSKPKSFSGTEVIDNPYALTHWYREVACWVEGYASDPTQQVVLALQTLTGTARIMVDNIIMADRERVPNLPSLFSLLKETFQRRDPGPDAWREFQRARLRQNRENVITYLNRLLLLSFVINMSDDPTCPRVGEDDIATKLRIGLPYDIGNKVEQHMQLMVDLERKPDVSPWGIAAIALKVEAQDRDKARRVSRTARPLDQNSHGAKSVATVHALPQKEGSYSPSVRSIEGRAAKRFRDLSEELQKRIVAAQTQMKNLPLGASLSQDQLKLCQSNSLCIKCRRYGHDAKHCRHTQPMMPKN